MRTQWPRWIVDLPINAKKAPASELAGPLSFPLRTRGRACAIDVTIDGPEPGCREAARVGGGLHLFPPLARRLVAHDSVHGVNTPQRPPISVPPADGSGTTGHPPDDDQVDTRDLVDIPAVEVISRAAVLLMSAA